MDTAAVTDLTDLLPTEELTLEILSPNGKPTGWRWTLAATNHAKKASFHEARAARDRARAKVLRKAQFNGIRYEAESKTPEESRREDVQWIVPRTLDWTPVRIA